LASAFLDHPSTTIHQHINKNNVELMGGFLSGTLTFPLLTTHPFYTYTIKTPRKLPGGR
jgi:hypothetical protein